MKMRRGRLSGKIVGMRLGCLELEVSMGDKVEILWT